MLVRFCNQSRLYRHSYDVENLSWPGIEDLNLNLTLGTTTATAKGHLNQERKNLQSTKMVKQEDKTDEDNFPTTKAKMLSLLYNNHNKTRGRENILRLSWSIFISVVQRHQISIHNL